MLLLCALIVGSSSLWATEEVYYSLTGTTGGSNNSYTGNCDIIVGETPKAITWNVAGNAQQSPWRIGGKKLTSATNRTVYSKTKMSEVISKVVYTFGSTFSSQLTINSVTLTVSTGANGGGTIIDEVSKTSGFGANQTLTFQPSEGKTWSKDAYYKFTFNLTTDNTNTNRFFEFKQADFYYNPADSSPLDHITLGGTYPTEFYQGDTFSHDGLTVTAHYEDNSTADVTSNATFSGYDMSTLGNQTVTVSYSEGSIDKTATYNINIIPIPQPVVTLDFTDAAWGLPSAYDESEKSYTNKGYTITLGESSNGHKKVMNNTEIASLLFGKKDATLTLPAFGFDVTKLKVFGYSSAGANVTFNVFVGEDAVSTEATSSKVDHEFAIAADKRSAGTIYTIKVTNSNNCQISKIEVYGNGCETGLVGDAGWATYVTTSPVRFLEGDAFAVTSASDKVYMETVTDVPSNTPVILKGTGRKTATLLDAEPAAPANELAISDGSAVDGFVLAKKNDVVGFYKWNGGSLTSGKVYLPSSAVTSSSRDFIGFEGDVTGINEVKNEKETVNGIFDLQGRKVITPSKGLYIVNGKKVVIK